MKSGGLARLIALALILVAVGLSLPAGRMTDGLSFSAPPSPSRLQAQPLAVFRGSPSCAATACHGAVQPGAGRILRNEYITWIERDKHASAREVLFSPRSQSIAAKLNALPAHRDPRGLACHESRSGAMSENPRDPSHDGVGCESCHGAWDRWIGEHTGFDWARRADDEKELLGMIPTRDLVRRARARRAVSRRKLRLATACPHAR